MKSSDPDDRELMSDVSAGSIEAFGQLYDRFCNRAYRVAHSVCRDEGRAQDAVQEAFLAIWKSRTTYHPQRGTVAGWLLTVVRYRAIDLARRNGNHAARWASDDRLDEHPAPDDIDATVVERDSADRLRASLARLPDEQQEVIGLAYYGQLSHTEIATVLRLPPGTVKGRMRLGLQKLRASMKQAAAEPAHPADGHG
ncbi:MAG: RNA polymerase sigma factor [Solirubrobacteraceae bacterium]